MSDRESIAGIAVELESGLTLSGSPLQSAQILNKHFKKLLNEALSGEDRYFSGTFAKLNYLANTHAGLAEISESLHYMRRVLNGITRKKASFPSAQFIGLAKNTLLSAIEILSRGRAEKRLLLEPFQPGTIPAGERVADTTCNVTAKLVPTDDTRRMLKAQTEEQAEVFIVLTGNWQASYDQVWQGCKLRLLNARLDFHGERILLVCDRESIAVLEPDYLVDITRISELFSAHGANPYIEVVKKITAEETGTQMIMGNIVNSLFDEAIYDPGIGFDAAFARALKARPLQIFALEKMKPGIRYALKSDMLPLFGKIKEVTSGWHNNIMTVEPAFISPKYGLQGRLDLLVEYEEDSDRKDLVELKSGKAPNSLRIRTDDGSDAFSDVWINHLMQTTGYNLILDSVYAARTGSSSILYINAERNALRNTDNYKRTKREFIAARNETVHLDKRLAEDPLPLIDFLSSPGLTPLPSYMEAKCSSALVDFFSLSDIKREYFLQCLMFLSRETFASKIGAYQSRNNYGFSALWRESSVESTETPDPYAYFTLRAELSDLSAWHLLFIYEGKELLPYRKGDQVILFPADESGLPLFESQQIFKAVIKEISARSYKVSLRNKLPSSGFLMQYERWEIKPDNSDSLGKKYFHSAAEGIYSPQADIILGLEEPKFEDMPDIEFPHLEAAQAAAVNGALKSKNIHLIQGPPGTGKTSYVLRTIAEQLHDREPGNILLAAFTNRAADEICEALLASDKKLSLLRLGSKESSSHKKILISELAESISYSDLYARIEDTRIIVSTVAALHSNPEIFILKKFSTLIVDEASQLLEPHLIGLIGKCGRTVMIGDERQLPAISVQDSLPKENGLLNPLGWKSFSVSLFERLAGLYQDKGWYGACAMLTMQSRMHPDIAALANKLFYTDQLTDNPALSSDCPYGPAVEWMECPVSSTPKSNEHEAALITQMIHELIRDRSVNPADIGVIAPFRSQCSEILGRLPEEYRSAVTVDTVERFQGTERDVIFYSTVSGSPAQLRLAKSQAKIGGLLVDRKLNVAITRAKRKLVILGNEELLSSDIVYARLITLIKERC